MLTEFGTFRDEAQTVKVHIGAGQNTDKRLVLAAVLFDVVLDAGNGKGAGRFKDASCILENIFDCGADFIRIDQHDAVDKILAKLLSLFADELNCRAVGEKADIGD